MPEGVLENFPDPGAATGAPSGVLDTNPFPPFVVGDRFGVLAGNFVYGRVVYFEETTRRDQARTLDGEQRMVRTFVAYTSSPLVASTTVAAFDQTLAPFPAGYPGAQWNGKPERRVPRPGDRYVELDADWNKVHENEHVVCAEVHVEADADDPQKWHVTAQYAGVSDPVAEPHDVEWDEVPYQEAILVEAEALPPNPAPRAILNSAKDPFAEGVMRDKDRSTVTIVKNVISYDPVATRPYQNSTNAETVFAAQHPPGFPPGTAKIKIKAKRIRRSHNRDFYWRVTGVVEIDEQGWDARVRDAGFNYLPGGDAAAKQPIRSHPRFAAWGGPSTAQLLKPDGDLADPDQPVPDPLTFRRYKRKSWGPLNYLLNF